MVRPFLVTLFPSSNVLGDELGTELLGFGDCAMSPYTKLACWVIDGNQPLPKRGKPMTMKGFLFDYSGGSNTIAERRGAYPQEGPTGPSHTARKRHQDRYGLSLSGVKMWSMRIGD